jgi:anti-sigma factor ChrR (cupin superfamily)
MSAAVHRISPDERRAGPATPGMVREEAVSTKRSWAGLVTTEAGMVSGWHHHAGYETTIYVLTGALRMEFGPGGTGSLDAVHRESNPTDEASRIVVWRSGSGEAVVNVDGPQSAAS